MLRAVSAGLLHLDSSARGRQKAPSKPMRPSSFTLDDSPAFAGYSDGTRWNGWACPVMTRAQCDVAAAYFNALDPEPVVWFEGDRLAFRTGCPDEPVCYLDPLNAPVDGQPVWPFGDGWIWDEV